MATVSRRLLVLAAILFLVAGLGINIAEGGSTLLVVAAGFTVILLITAWSLFDASSKSSKVQGSTAIKSNYSTGQSMSELNSENQDQQLPDPLESGYEIPLM